MPLETILLWGVVAAAVIAAGIYLVHGAWLALGAWRIRRAGPRPLSSVRHALWRDPGEVERLDLRSGPGGVAGLPSPPFRFLEEHDTGTHPCVSVKDAGGRRWRVKWGPEVNAEAFAVRLVSACGYFAEITHYVAEGRIEDARDLRRAAACIDNDSRFTAARFELDDPDVRKLFEEHSWAWDDNPFVGSRQLQGLKILTMLLSNWDTKDRRDVARGSNTAIFEQKTKRGREARYLITDWGGAMGSWGGNIITRGRWDADAFERQTPGFVTGVDEDDVVTFGYTGQRTEDIAAGITVGDVRWLVRYLARVTDRQLRDALDASGATLDEVERFAGALRSRISMLVRVAERAHPHRSASPWA